MRKALQLDAALFLLLAVSVFAQQEASGSFDPARELKVDLDGSGDYKTIKAAADFAAAVPFGAGSVAPSPMGHLDEHARRRYLRLSDDLPGRMAVGLG